MLSPSTDKDRGAGAIAACSTVAKHAGRGHLTVTRPRGAFVYRESGLGPSRGSPHPAARFLLRRPLLLNLVPNVPAPKPWAPEAKIVRAAGIGRCWRAEPASSEFLLAGGGRWVARARQSRPRLKVTWRTRAPREGSSGAVGRKGACPAEVAGWGLTRSCWRRTVRSSAKLPLPALSSLR